MCKIFNGLVRVDSGGLSNPSVYILGNLHPSGDPLNPSLLFHFSMGDPALEGCLVAGRQGLCIDAAGKSDPNTAGILVAISDQAAKLEPNCHPPTVILEYADK